MHDPTSKPFVPSIEVSPDNPCPFLRGLVGEGFVAGGTVPLNTLSQSIGVRAARPGLGSLGRGSRLADRHRSPTAPPYPKSICSGAQLDALRSGPLDKLGAGSRILGATAWSTRTRSRALRASAGLHRSGLGGASAASTPPKSPTYMRDELQARRQRRALVLPDADEVRMAGPAEDHRQGQGKDRYLSVADVRTLFEQRNFPLASASGSSRSRCCRLRAQVSLGARHRAAALLFAAALDRSVAVAEFPNQVRAMLPQKGIRGGCCRRPCRRLPETTAAYWLEQNWSLEDRYWFHHASQGTATFPVPYDWFMALEQPTLHLFSGAGMLKDSAYLERFGFIPSPQSIQTDETTLRRFRLCQRLRDDAGRRPVRPLEDAGRECRRTAGRLCADDRRRSIPRPAAARRTRSG